MWFQNFKTVTSLAASLILLACLLSVSVARAHDGLHGSGTQNKPSAQASPRGSSHEHPPEDLKLSSNDFQPQHGGQIAATKWHFFEVVYMPQETRLYVYSPSKRPLSAHAVSGEIILQVNGNEKQYRYPLKPMVARSVLGNDLGYLVATVDVTRVRDNDMRVSFDLKLTSREEPRARFEQTFALTLPPVPVTIVRLTDADQPLVEQQRMCPVMKDSKLGSHGLPIKLMVGNQPLFVCCEGCIEEVKKNPRRYMELAATQATRAPQPQRPQVNIFWATEADDAEIRAQGRCPVTDQLLGAHGRPLKVVIDGRPIFVCCEGCIDKVVKDRDFYFNKLANAFVPNRIPPSPAQTQTLNQEAPRRHHIVVGYATGSDRLAVQTQGECPVMHQPLGGHGTPIKITIDGQSVFVCCRGCVEKVKQNPDLYMSKVVRSPQLTANATQDAWFYRKPPAAISGSGGSCCSGKHN